MISRTMRVTVWSKPVECQVFQKSKTVWVAMGDYLGESVTAQGRSATSAAKLWAETARYRGG